MQSIRKNHLLYTLRAIRKFPAEFFYLDWQGMGLGIYAQNLTDKLSVTLPWQSSQSAMPMDPSLSVEPARQHEGFLVQLPRTYLPVLLQWLQSLSCPDLGIRIEDQKVILASGQIQFPMPATSIRSWIDAEITPAPKESSPDYPVCSLPLSVFRDLLKKSLQQVDPKATDPRMRGVCFELSAHTPNTCIREGVCASLPISRVDLRLSATNGETLSVMETPVTWHCLKNLRAFRQVGQESLDWTSKALSSLASLVDKALLTLSFFDDLHGLRLSVDPVDTEQNSAPGFAIDLPWEAVPFLNYLPWLQAQQESPQVTLPATTILSACRLQHAIASDYLRLEDLGKRLGLLSGTATQERIEQALDRLSASLGSRLACLESQPIDPIEHPAVQALLENQSHALPARKKKSPSLDGLNLCVTALTDPVHQAWAVTEPVQRDSNHNGQRATTRLLSTHALLQSLQQLKGSQITLTLPDRSLLRIDKVQPKGRETHVISCKVLEPAIGQRELLEQVKPTAAIAQAPENTRDFANAVLASRNQAVPIVPSD